MIAPSTSRRTVDTEGKPPRTPVEETAPAFPILAIDAVEGADLATGGQQIDAQGAAQPPGIDRAIDDSSLEFQD